LEKLSSTLLLETDPSRLWQQFQQGDNQALGTLAAHYYRPLLNYGLRFSPDRELLKDLIQDLFMELWSNRQRLHVPVSVKAYLMGAFRNKIYKQRIQASRLAVLDESGDEFTADPGTPSAEAALIEDENQQLVRHRIRQLLTELPKRQQEIIYLYFYEGLDTDQVALVMDIGKQSVYNLLSRTLKELRASWPNGVRILSLLALHLGRDWPEKNLNIFG
jgi:RNA polymerase sigma factor (sigma-70 family)